MSLAPAAQAELLDQLSHLSEDQNPYLAIAAALRSKLFPTVPVSAIHQLYLIAAALGAQHHPSRVRVARATMGEGYLLDRPDAAAAAHDPASLEHQLVGDRLRHAHLFEVVIVHAVQFFRQEPNKAFGSLFLLVWTVAWLGGSAATWSLGVSYILHVQATTQRSVEHLAVISNVGAVIALIVYLSILLPFACLASRGYADAIDVFRAIKTQLVAKAATWNEGDAFSPFELAPMLPLLQEMGHDFEVFIKWYKPTFIVYGVSALQVTISLVSIAYIHLSSLRRMLQSTRQASPNLQVPNALSGMTRRIQHKRVEQTLRSLLLTILLFSFLGLLFFAVAIYGASSPESLVTPVRSQLIILLPLYAFAVFDLPCDVILVLRARDASAAEEATTEGSSAHKSNSAHGGIKKKIRFGTPAGGSGLKENEFSIQLASMPSIADAVTNSSGGGSWRDWLGRGSGDARGGVLWDGSVSVTVDVDVVVEGEAEYDEKPELERRPGDSAV
ncbi:hypothetical protein Rt10032_c03g1593 [Rhodotorula toruloides]|uniref:Uncharacterized protein n=1 Tax=Rhodotorula toruloides TaxID=5286 RepID=A0A511KCB4_RHOTO|nr:hypothetical protein Rt10032_c03g1593 [Rhodotorula toruloides]